MTLWWSSPCRRVVLYHGDSLDVLPTLDANSAGLVCADPPYAEEAHKGARTGSGDTILIDFASTNDDALRARFVEVARVANRWVIATMDWRHVRPLEASPPPGLKFVRFGVWTKPDGAPQFTGDRPGTGWEAVVIMHRDAKGRMRWNGGGRTAVFNHGISRSGDYPTQKPLPLIREFVELFSDPGDLVLDPFCGSGTTLVAALERGRRAIGIDISEKALGIARARCEAVLGQGALFEARKAAE